jgi:SAM-dependent methyltransferase
MGVHDVAPVEHRYAKCPCEHTHQSYPAQAVAVLADALPLRPGSHVVDLGAGTGKFTRLLALTGARVTAVEPDRAQRERLASLLPSVQAVPGTAEVTGLPDHVADVVVVAHAWHWFDAPAALEEIERILVPGGSLALVWHSYDESVPWIADYTRVYARQAPAEPACHHGEEWRHLFDELPGWSPLEEHHIPNPHSTTREAMVDRLLSAAPMASLSYEDRERVRQEVFAVLNRHEETRATDRIEFPYRTDLFWTRRN